MKTLVTCNEDPTYIREIENFPANYNADERSFEFPAGGYIITSAKLFKILKVDFDNSKSNILFEKIAEIDDFCNWLTWAESDASNSYGRMLD